MKTQEEYAREIDEIVRRDVESYQSDWFKIDKEIFKGILMNYWDVYDCMDEVEEPTDDDWLNAVSNLFDSYTYDVENTDVDKFKMSDVMNVYRIINL